MSRMQMLVILSLLAVPGAATAIVDGQSKAEVTLRAAAEKETVQGDLKGAIGLYGQAIKEAGSNRGVAVRALMAMADAYRKLGDSQAREIYAQVVREFADQPIAAEARTRLAAMRIAGVPSAARATGDRVVWAGQEVFSDGRVSPDGRFVSNTDWNTGNLMLRDLVGGEDRTLADSKGWTVGNANTSTFSRDGKQVAYGWRQYGEKAHVNELRIVNVEGTGIPQPRRVFGTEDIDFIDPSDWSPDGKWLAVHVLRKDRSGQIALVGVHDGSFRALKTVGWRGPDKIFFSPDGKYLAYDLPASDTESQRDVFIIAVDGSRETRAVEHPATDVVTGWSPDGSQLLFASDRTGAVGLWALPVSDGKPHAAPALIKPDIGSVSSLGLTASGALHIVKDASTMSLQVAPIDLDAGKLSGAPVLENFRSENPSWSPDGTYLAYASTGANGIRILSIRSMESRQMRELRPALLYFNAVRWLPDGRSMMTFGRDLKGRQGIYQIDAQNGNVSFITNGDGSVQVSPDGKKIYYTVGYFTPADRPARFVERDVASGQTREVFRRFPNSGGAELSPDGRSLATITFDSDAKTSRVLLVPVEGGEPRELLRASQPEGFSAYGSMSWTPDSRALLVVKTNGSPRDRKELWLVPVSDGKARKLDIDMDGWATGIRLHPNGRQIAFFTGQSSREVCALENLFPAAKPRR